MLEYAGGGELFNLISSDGKLKEGDAVCVFAQLLSAVSYLVSWYTDGEWGRGGCRGDGGGYDVVRAEEDYKEKEGLMF